MRAKPNWGGADHVVDRFRTVMTEFELSGHKSADSVQLDTVWRSEPQV